MINLLERYFQDHDEIDAARTEMARCRQGSRSVEEYNIQFQALTLLMGYNDVAHVKMYKNGLKPAVMETIY